MAPHNQDYNICENKENMKFLLRPPPPIALRVVQGGQVLETWHVCPQNGTVSFEGRGEPPFT